MSSNVDAIEFTLNVIDRGVTIEKILQEAAVRKAELSPSHKEGIILDHLPLIRYIVNRIAVRLPAHIDLDDLYNTGVIGLMDAIEKYDPEKSAKFKTYAEFRIEVDPIFKTLI